jgi:hypothetical protein
VFEYAAGMNRTERLAVASITGIAEAYGQLHRLDWDQAMTEVQDSLRHWRVAADRIEEVLSNAAVGYLDSENPGAQAALQFVLHAGANLDRTRLLAEERRRRPGIQIGDARLG